MKIYKKIVVLTNFCRTSNRVCKDLLATEIAQEMDYHFLLDGVQARPGDKGKEGFQLA